MDVETANRLVEMRKKNGYSQEELADKIGVSRQAVSKWERAESSPDTDNLIALSRLYNISLDELLFAGGTGSQPENAIGAGPASPNGANSNNGSMSPDQEYANNGTASPTKDRDPKGVLVALPYPIIATILFFVISFATGRWEYAWLIFLTIPIYYWIARVVDKNKEKD